MSSFSRVLLEEGVELEIQADLHQVTSALDQEIPQFECNGYGYRLTTGKGQLGVKMLQMVRLVSKSTNQMVDSPVGHLEIAKMDDGMTKFKIPPRAEMTYPGIAQFDPEGTYFGSFIYHILNAFQKHQLINLPGVMPTA